MNQSNMVCVRAGCTNPIDGSGLYCSAHTPKATEINRFAVAAGLVVALVLALLFVLVGAGAVMEKIKTVFLD